ncbi:hypothetical protein SARC_06153 [Sphaeroforma arctica JP610]|uniref:Saccharopine dehydrogenase NADP binding domain-containing protein n=1 Tax=Sphaeroforma arctica JP610 TaxID=667725 RepID=A0A0L0FY86_9EUKA|nr:hypothetical protein SARC_06153 [Sphaeroforma arctica JP610]KNC81526.1 hypothetical protein SARC_06153 [Sphaeroforma arctica JP610]|eukprot:XP_014155428.1 hypothetical protein SARC_06153 [Sphaeroforma arctica JP610]
MARQHDYVVFGCTGFTGEFVLEEMLRLNPKGKIAAAGRSHAKVEATVKRVVGRVEGCQIADVAIVVADVKDTQSMTNMAKSTQLILNCVGPFRFFGEPVVKCCAENGTHYVDITGEPEFMERMYLKYNDVAKSNGSLIVNACGFDSIPADLGCEFAVQQFKDRQLVSKVESFLFMHAEKGGSAHYTTYECAIHGFANQGELKQTRQQIKAMDEQNGRGGAISTIGPRPKPGDLIPWNKAMDAYTLPFPGSDASVVRRTQLYMDKVAGLHPVNFGASFCVKSTLYLFITSIVGMVFTFLAKYEFGRKLLLDNPKLFSFGVFSHEGPTIEQIHASSFEMRMIVSAYDSHAAMKDHKTKAPTIKKMIRVIGPEPGYIATSSFIVCSALSLVEDGKERAKRGNGLDIQGGVYTPAVALFHEKFIQRLAKRNIKFETMAI